MIEKDLEEKWKTLWQESKGSVYQSLEWVKIREKCGEKIIPLVIESNMELEASVIPIEGEEKLPVIGAKKIIFAHTADDLGNAPLESVSCGLPVVVPGKKITEKYIRLFKHLT